MHFDKTELKIGSTVWVWDPSGICQRADGLPFRGGCWSPIKIYGENKTNWLAGYSYEPIRINKKKPRGRDGHDLALSSGEVARIEAIKTLRREINNKFSVCQTDWITDEQYLAIAKILQIKVNPIISGN